jgi:hypothetical protein
MNGFEDFLYWCRPLNPLRQKIFKRGPWVISHDYLFRLPGKRPPVAFRQRSGSASGPVNPSIPSITVLKILLYWRWQ